MDEIDPVAIRAALAAERVHLVAELGEAIQAPGQMTYGSQAAAATQVFEQQRDLALRDRASQQLELVDAALARLDAGTFGIVPALRQADRAGAPRGASLGRPLHRMPGDRRPGWPVIDAPALVTIDAIRGAADVLRGIAIRTPLVPYGPPEDRILLKAESLQPIGAFKIRGAYVAIAGLAPAERDRGVITYSSGNHAQGVARAARLLGAPAVVVMPSDAPAIKRERVAADGAEIVTVGTASEERRERAEAIAAERGLAIIPPYDDDRIIAGQGTVGLEIAEDLADVAAGPRADRRRRTRERCRRGDQGAGPGSAGHRRGTRARRRCARVARAWGDRRLVRGRRVADDRRWHANPGAGRRTFAHLRAHLDGIVTVSEEEIAAAVRLAAEGSRLVAEPSGALALAAIAFRGDELGLRDLDGPVVGVISGGNVDPVQYRAYLEAPLPG